MTAAVRRVVDAILGLARIEPPEVESALGVKLARVGDTRPPVEYYEAPIPSGPFGSVDFRINRQTGLAFLVLDPRPSSPLPEASLDLKPYGPIADTRINPDIPPEGTQSFLQDAGGVRIAWQLTMRSRILRGVSFDWSAVRK